MLPSSSPADGSLAPGVSKQLPPKRNRVQLSCTHCRQSKLKCDREQPCLQCVKRGRASQCAIPAPAPRRKPVVSMQNRLKHLESLVKDVMTGQSSGGMETGSNVIFEKDRGMRKSDDFQVDQRVPHQQFPESAISLLPSPTDKRGNASGSVVEGNNETTYVGATHWAAILDDIEEVRSYFNEEESQGASTIGTVMTDESWLFNTQKLSAKEELMEELPVRSVVDRLVSRYFNSNTPALHIIHRPTFQVEYGKFWADPAGTSVAWLAMLYGMMSLATFAALSSGEENPDTRGSHMEMIQLYQKRCTQSLVLSKYTQPGPYTVEAMLIYMEGEFVMKRGNQVYAYILLGVAIRLALRIGLHRDSSKVGGNISACQGEMRRRVWHTLVQVDLLGSFHIGLPSMAQAVESDTEYPRNLRDDDFSEESTELPGGRPMTEMTPILYTLCKGRLIAIFGKIVTQANKISLPPYDEVIRLDRLIDQALADVPSFFHLVPLELAITTSPEILIIRFSLAILYHKSRCVLHRKYLMKERENHKYGYSKTVGLDASLALLRCQVEVNEAVQAGGPLSRDKWFIASFSFHDFLLAATILYMIIIQSINSDGKFPSNDVSKKRQHMISTIERSREIWRTSSAFAIDSQQASDVLGLMLKKVYRALGDDSESSSKNAAYQGNGLLTYLSLDDPNPPNLIPDTSLHFNGTWPASASDSTTPSSGVGVHSDPSISGSLEPLGNMLDIPMNFDWDTFDNHLRPQPTTADPSSSDFSFDNFEFSNENYYNP